MLLQACAYADAFSCALWNTKLVCEKIERRDAKAQKNNLEKAKGHGAKHSSLCSLLSQKISSALLRLCV